MKKKSWWNSTNDFTFTQVEDGAVYRVGDTVRVEEDKEKVSREQKAHGGWRDEMAEVYYTHNSRLQL